MRYQKTCNPNEDNTLSHTNDGDDRSECIKTETAYVRMLKSGFRLGGIHQTPREKLHERKG